MNKNHPYYNKLWWRIKLPWFLIDLGFAKKGINCKHKNALHKWYKIDRINSGCYYCQKITKEINWKKI